ncbi:MAG: rhodanese-like domain-containing protein [Helicobacteraceae bacterium]|jgi:phage shock protein E|nr:rhodanese-like domain-containing protein [Helicobacteraceae bacterium]
MNIKFINIALIAALSSATVLFAAHPETEKLLIEAKKEAGEMTPKQLKEKIDKEEAVIILDVRESEQRAEGQIYADDMYAITRGNLEFEILNQVKDKDAVIVTYCRGGSRGALAAQSLRHLGYKNATNLQGGLKGWAKAGYPIETGLGITKLTGDE